MQLTPRESKHAPCWPLTSMSTLACPPAVALAPDSRHRVCSVQCVSLKPDWGKGYSRLGAAYFGLEEWDKAIEAYDAGWSCGPVGGLGAQHGSKSGPDTVGALHE